MPPPPLSSTGLEQRGNQTTLRLPKLNHSRNLIIDVLQELVLVPLWLPPDAKRTLRDDIFTAKHFSKASSMSTEDLPRVPQRLHKCFRHP